MSATIEEFSRNRCFRLLRQRDGDREQVRLVLARSGDVVLDLSVAGCRVDGCAFDVGGRALLHLRLSREDGSLVMYPATLDLDSGLFYHGDPRHAHAPAGQAADMERIARGDGLPPAYDPARAVRWPVAERLAAEAVPLPAEPQPEPAAAEQSDEKPAVEPQQSFDGRWRLEAWTFEDGPDGYQGHARILDNANQQVVFDLDGSNWYSRGRFNPCAYQLWLQLRHADGVQRLKVFIDLDCLMYWEQDEAGNFLAGGRLAAPLAELQQRLLAPSARGTPQLSVVARAKPERRSVTSPDDG